MTRSGTLAKSWGFAFLGPMSNCPCFAESAKHNECMTSTKLTKSEIKTLKLRIASYWAELQTCTTDAMARCVKEQIEGAAQTLSRGHW